MNSVRMKQDWLWMVLLLLQAGFCLTGNAAAQTIDRIGQLSDAALPADTGSAAAGEFSGTVESTGTHFEVTGGGYLNITLDSTETITVRLTSAPRMVTMRIDASDEASGTLFTISGFEPSTTYYKYEDNYHNLTMFTTDAEGVYRYEQDLAAAHYVYIQPRKSTKFLSDSATGGDCASIGIWDSATRTCTLVMDLNETVQIDSNNITLDGNGHRITGYGTGYGVYLPGRTGVTVKGLVVSNFGDGIYLRSSSSCTITGNAVTSSTAGAYWGAGIHVDYSNGNSVVGNSSSNNVRCGISLSYSNDNVVSGNSAIGNEDGYCTGYSATNVFSGNTAERNYIGYWNLGNAKYTAQLNNRFEQNSASNNTIGMHLGASYSTLTGNTVSGNEIGINLYGATYNTLLDNIVRENRSHDIASRYAWLTADFGMILTASSWDCTNTIENTTGSGGLPLKYFNTAVDLHDEVLSGLILCNADGSTLSNITIAGSDTLNNNGLILLMTDSATLTNITSSQNRTGVYLVVSTGNTVRNSLFRENEDGIRMTWCSNNTIQNNSSTGNSRAGIVSHHGVNDSNVIRGNVISGGTYGIYSSSAQNVIIADNEVLNTGYGLGVYSGTNTMITGNRVRNSSVGLYLQSTSDNKVYNNSFIDNASAASIASASGTVLDLAAPVGGNYWSSYDSPAEGCIDANSDDFCDAPLALAAGSVDHLPWTKQDGWSIPADTIPPVTALSIVGIPGKNDWFRSDVLLSLAAADNDGGSGVKEIRSMTDGGPEAVSPGTAAAILVITEGSHSVGYYAVDNAGNREAAHVFSVNIDKTAPVIMMTGIVDGASYPLASVPAAGYSVTDALSGVDTQNSSVAGGNGNNVGAYTYTVTASDQAGNTVVAKAAYNVVYNFSGFLAPVSLNKPFKLGSTIPVIFRLSEANGNPVTSAVASMTIQPYSNGEPAGDPIEALSTSAADSGSLFRFDATSSQYIYNLSTASLAAGTWKILVTLDDGTVKTTSISIKTN